MLILVLAATGTAIATGVGAIPVYMLGERAEGLREVLAGVAGGVMTVASVLGLLKPALENGSALTVWLGVLVGVGFLLGTRALLGSHEPSLRSLRGVSVRTSLLVFIVLFAHSLPEGLAIGTAYASKTAGLGLFVILAIAIQNVPEGTSIAIPMQHAGFGAAAQFWAAVGTSVPQPIGAVVAYVAVEQAHALLPASFGFAAGAMLALVAAELLPDALGGQRPARGAFGLLAGGGVMAVLSLVLAV